ncbi:MAG: transposase [Chloroflexota bacterium]
MIKVEQHIIQKSDSRWSVIDAACFRSKNLFNAVLYRLRQTFFTENKTLSYPQLANDMKQDPDYCALPRKVSQWVLKQVTGDWQSFWSAQKAYQSHPTKFLGRPKLPNYKDKVGGRNILTYTIQALSKKLLRQGIIAPSQLPIEVQTQVDPDTIQQVRIVPRKTHYIVEVVYKDEVSLAQLPPNRVAGIDVGLNNLAAVTSNQQGLSPFLINGRPLKSINQHYNKRRAWLRSQLQQGQYTSKQIQRLTDKRNRQVKHYLHSASKYIIKQLVQHGIGTLIIGKNEGWKQSVNMGKRNTQQFVQLPHAQFIEMLTYKAEEEGIQVILTEESYTSKCSFLDQEALQKQIAYAGKRVKRGLFRAKDGRTINADVNAAANIIRKVIPNAFADGIEAIVVSPVRVLPV